MMTTRKALLALATAALVSAPAWTAAGATPAGNLGSSHRSGTGTEHAGGNGRRNRHLGDSHRCKPHTVAYVASGRLVSQGLTQNGDGTYSGTLTVEVKRSNHHAAADRGTTREYEVEGAHVTFGLPRAKSGAAAGLEDLTAGDRARVIGKITALAKRCPSSGFTPTTTIHRVVFHEPPPAKP